MLRRTLDSGQLTDRWRMPSGSCPRMRRRARRQAVFLLACKASFLRSPYIYPAATNWAKLRSHRRQHEVGAQPADRRRVERQLPAIKAGKLDDDREPQSGAGLGLVEAAAAACLLHLLALDRG